MKLILLYILLASFFGGSIQVISETNRYAREAAEAYRQHDYTYAIAAYEYLLNKLEVEDDQIRLNLAHAYFRASAYEKAKLHYQQLAKHPSQHIKALATLQLGNVAVLQKKFKKGLSHYRMALIAEPGNETARYNYELLKKYLEQHPELNQDEREAAEPITVDEAITPDSLSAPPAEEHLDAPAPKKKPDAQGNEQEETESREQDKNGTIEDKSGAGNQHDKQQDKPETGNQEKEEASGSNPGDTLGQNTENGAGNEQRQQGSAENITDQDLRAQTQRARLQQMNLTPEKAQLLLDAMRNAEIQYIQQLPRKATRKPDKSKPDW